MEINRGSTLLSSFKGILSINFAVIVLSTHMGEKFLKLCHEPISYALRFAVNTSTSYEMTKIVRALIGREACLHEKDVLLFAC